MVKTADGDISMKNISMKNKEKPPSGGGAY